jgi:hypothetical protein
VQPPFVGHTIAEIGRQYANRRALISERSRRLYGQSRKVIERKLERWSSTDYDPNALSLRVERLLRDKRQRF